MAQPQIKAEARIQDRVVDTMAKLLETAKRSESKLWALKNEQEGLLRDIELNAESQELNSISMIFESNRKYKADKRRLERKLKQERPKLRPLQFDIKGINQWVQDAKARESRLRAKMGDNNDYTETTNLLKAYTANRTAWLANSLAEHLREFRTTIVVSDIRSSESEAGSVLSTRACQRSTAESESKASHCSTMSHDSTQSHDSTITHITETLTHSEKQTLIKSLQTGMNWLTNTRAESKTDSVPIAFDESMDACDLGHMGPIAKRHPSIECVAHCLQMKNGVVRIVFSTDKAYSAVTWLPLYPRQCGFVFLNKRCMNPKHNKDDVAGVFGMNITTSEKLIAQVSREVSPWHTDQRKEWQIVSICRQSPHAKHPKGVYILWNHCVCKDCDTGIEDYSEI